MKRNHKNFYGIIVLFAAMSLCSLASNAQGWRVGVEGGWLNNAVSRNTQYAYDYRYQGKNGFDAGLWGQYNFKDWIGVRADLVWLNRGHKMHRNYTYMNKIHYTETDGYLALPVMASFSFGGRKIRGFVNLGGYIGFWATSHWKGTAISLTDPVPGDDAFIPYDYDCKRAFDSRRDNRFEAGLVGGAGIDWEFLDKWHVGAEVRYYYGLTSVTKDYMANFKDPRYNNTLTIMLSFSRAF